MLVIEKPKRKKEKKSTGMRQDSGQGKKDKQGHVLVISHSAMRALHLRGAGVVLECVGLCWMSNLRPHVCKAGVCPPSYHWPLSMCKFFVWVNRFSFIVNVPRAVIVGLCNNTSFNTYKNVTLIFFIFKKIIFY